MHTWKRHIGVPLLILVAAAVIAFLTPSDVDPQVIFFCAVILIFLYISISYMRSGRRR